MDWEAGMSVGKRWPEYVISVGTILAAIAAAVAAGATAWQASVARDTERRQLRAYVFMNGLSVQAMGHQNDEVVWVPKARWRNSGATPTRDLKIFSSVGSQYANGPFAAEITSYPLTLGPADEALIRGGAAVPSSRIQSFRATGLAVYRDAFGHYRITMACRGGGLIKREDLNAAKLGDTLELDSLSCGEGYCADEDCKPYRDQIGDRAPTSAFDP
jgi:hypothetical protein